MINIDFLPCGDCKHFAGIKQPDGTERTEYVACKRAPKGKANELLKVGSKTVDCPYQAKMER